MSGSSRLHSDRTFCWGLILLVALASGCGGGAVSSDKHQRATATGSATFNGEPIPAGTVIFTNIDSGIQSTCLIDGGAYESESGQGPVYGKNTVNVIGLEAEGGQPQWSGVWSREVDITGDTFTQDFAVKEEEVQPFKDIGMDEEAPLY